MLDNVAGRTLAVKLGLATLSGLAAGDHAFLQRPRAVAMLPPTRPQNCSARSAQPPRCFRFPYGAAIAKATRRP